MNLKVYIHTFCQKWYCTLKQRGKEPKSFTSSINILLLMLSMLQATLNITHLTLNT